MQQQQRQQTGGRGKATGFLVVALAVAGLLTFVVWKTFTGLQQQVAKAKEGPERVRVLVASRDIYMGEAITEGDVEVMAHLPELIYSERVFAEDQLGQLLNRTAKERILQGEVLREERLANADQGEGLNALIPRGLRAMTIDVDPESSLAGLLQPGNRVDVIVTIRPDDRNAGASWVTKTILQDKRVLAIGDRLRPTSAAEKAEEGKKRSRRKRPVVTLEVTPAEAEQLALASSRGDLHLILRSDVDSVQLEQGAVTTANALLDLNPAAPAGRGRSTRSSRRGQADPPPPTSGPRAEVIEGANTTSVQFDEDGNKVETSTQRRRR